MDNELCYMEWWLCMIYPSCKNGKHAECPVVYAGLIKCKCTCHKVIGIG